MAVVKHAERIIEKVIANQRIKPWRLPETDIMYKAQSEMPNAFAATEAPSEGNLSHLKVGIAQHYRVNNPYRYTATDENGYSTYKTVPWGCYKQSEIGGNKTLNAGAQYDITFGDITFPGTSYKLPTARIYYVMHTHMHRVSSMRRANGTGGPFQILFEEDGGFKHPLDGFNRTFVAPNWVRKGFKTAEHAVAFCENMGYGYEVEVPRHRYVTRKSYADNFKYRPAKIDD